MLVDLSDDLVTWRRQGTRFALATVIRTWSSAPQPPGSVMAVSVSGQVVGSVSGGCVESSVYALAEEVLASGVPQLVSFGVTNEDAYSVGLTCGGVIDVYVEPVDDEVFPEFDELLSTLDDDRACALVTVTGGGPNLGQHFLVRPGGGTAGGPGSDDFPCELSHAADSLGISSVTVFPADANTGPDAVVSAVVQSFAPKPRMLIFGAIAFAERLASVGAFLGFRVTVCDPRPVFTTSARFPSADDVVVAWPDRYLRSQPIDQHTAICVLTHDDRFDVSLLATALDTSAGYVGAMSSRSTNAKRMDALRSFGVSEDALARLRSPIGLDLGSRSTEETALAIAAEIVAVRNGHGAQPLRDIDTPIHG